MELVPSNKYKAQPKILRYYVTFVVLMLITPTIVAVIHNDWFWGQYTIQMQVPARIRQQYPSYSFNIGIFTTFEDAGYTHHEINWIITALITHISLSVIYGLINLGYCNKKLLGYSELLLVISSGIGFVLQIELHRMFIGIRQIGTVTVVSNAPGIMLSIFEGKSYWLFRVSTDFHLCLSLIYIISLLIVHCVDKSNNNDYYLFNNGDDNDDFKDGHRKKSSLFGAQQAFGGFDENEEDQ